MDWKWIRSGLEVDWKWIGSRLDVDWNWIGSVLWHTVAQTYYSKSVPYYNTLWYKCESVKVCQSRLIRIRLELD